MAPKSVTSDGMGPDNPSLGAYGVSEAQPTTTVYRMVGCASLHPTGN